MLCRDVFGADIGAIVFGWIFAAHQIGAAIAAFGAGAIRDSTGSYGGAFWTAALLCLVAAGLSLRDPADLGPCCRISNIDC